MTFSNDMIVETQITYLGTNTLVFKKGSSTLLVDPHFSRPRAGALLKKIAPDNANIEAGLKAAGVARLDGLLLTHTHYDHALDASEVIRRLSGRVYGSESAVNLVKGAGLSPQKATRVTPGKVYTIGQYQVIFHPSQHIKFPPPFGWLIAEKGHISKPLAMPAWFWEFQSGEVFAIQVDKTLVFGSAGFIPGAYDGLNINRVVLAAGGLETKPPSYLKRYYQQTVLATSAKVVLISHWDNFFRPLNQKLIYLPLVKRTIRCLERLGAQHGQSVKRLTRGNQIVISDAA